MSAGKLNKDTIQTLLVRIPVLLITFVQTILLIRLLGKEGNGVYVFLLANAQLGSVLLTLNLPRVFTYFLANGNFPKEKVAGLALWILNVATISFFSFALFSFYFDVPWLSLLLPSGYEAVFFCVFLVLYFLFLLVQLFCNALLEGSLKFKQLNQFSLFSNSLLFVALGSAFFLKHFQYYAFSLQETLGLILIVQLINGLAYLIFTQRSLKLRIDFNFRNIGLIKPFFRYALQGYLTNISHFLNMRVDIWFVETFHGAARLGIYGLAASLTNFMLLAIQPIAQVFMPHMAKMDIEAGKEMLLIYSRLTFLLAITLASGIFLLAPWFIPFLFGKEFEPAVLPVRILLLGFIFISIRHAFGAYVAARDQLQYLLQSNLISLAITIVLDIILIPQYGIIGASIASVCSYFTATFYLVYQVIKQIQAPWYRAFIFTKKDLLYWRNQFR